MFVTAFLISKAPDIAIPGRIHWIATEAKVIGIIRHNIAEIVNQCCLACFHVVLHKVLNVLTVIFATFWVIHQIRISGVPGKRLNITGIRFTELTNKLIGFTIEQNMTLS